jgi:hypothetical protein
MGVLWLLTFSTLLTILIFGLPLMILLNWINKKEQEETE